MGRKASRKKKQLAEPPPPDPEIERARIEIKPLQLTVCVDEELAANIRGRLEDAMHQIYMQGDAKGMQFEQLYGLVYHMVNTNNKDMVYRAFVNTTTRHLVDVLKDLTSAPEMFLFQSDARAWMDLLLEVSFFEHLNRRWTEFTKALKVVRVVFMYMERNCDQSTSSPLSLYDQGLKLWRAKILTGALRIRFVSDILHFIGLEREGKYTNQAIVRDSIRMLREIGPNVYREDFESHFLEAADHFYFQDSGFSPGKTRVNDYLKKVERRLIQETERLFRYDVYGETVLKVLDVVWRRMVQTHTDEILAVQEGGIIYMLNDGRFDDLATLYALLKYESQSLEKMWNAICTHLCDEGKSFSVDPKFSKDPIKFVQGLLDLQEKYDRIGRDSFQCDKDFGKAVSSTFTLFMNQNGRTAEFIALYVDEKLRKDMKKLTEEEIDTVFDRVMRLLGFVHDKDLFERFCKKHLANRLLSGRIVSEDAEKSFVVKLREECGVQSTRNLERMFKDMELSKDLVQGFNGVPIGKHPPADAVSGPMLSVQVLTTGLWPIQGGCGGMVNLPTEVLTLRENFTKYYLSSRKGRRLLWHTNKGTADIKISFGNGKKHELNVTTYQMCILVEFNMFDKLTFENIQKATGILGTDLKRSLHSLACVKGWDVLRKEPVSGHIGTDDVFFVNEMFTNPHYKVKIITSVAQKESDGENRQTRQKLEADRKPLVDAAIVRIMKARKTLDHKELALAVTEFLRPQFLPSSVTIKGRIESLLEREFLERDKTDPRVYHYLA